MILTTLLNFNKAPLLVTGIGIALVYPCLLTAQAVVLYSRLHLITQGPRLRIVLWLIVISSFILYIPFTVVLIGVSVGDPRFLPADRITERYTIIGSIGRELFICGIYIYEAFGQLEPIIAVKGRAGRKVMLSLFLVFGTVIVLDAILILTLYIGKSGLGLTYSCGAHSIKLKLEFGMLNKLLEMLGAPMNLRNGHGRPLPRFSDQDDSLVEMMQASPTAAGARGSLTPPGRAFRIHSS